MIDKLRFRLHALLVLTLLICLALWGGPRIYRWYHSVPLSEVLAECNQPIPFDTTGELTFPSPNVTEEEVLRAIQGFAIDQEAPADSRPILHYALRSKRLPEGSILQPRLGAMNSRMCVEVSLHIAASNDRVLFIPVREFPLPSPESFRSLDPLHNYDTTLLNDTQLLPQ